MADIGKLSAKIVADPIGFRTGLDTAMKEAKAWKTRVSSALNFATPVLPALGAGVIVSKLSSQIDVLENVGDEAARAGIGVDKFMRVVGELDSEDTMMAIDAMTKLRKTLGEVVGGSKEAAADLKAAGFDPAALSAMKLEDALQKVAQAYGAAEDPLKKFNIASAAFGAKAATELAPVMDKLENLSKDPAGKFKGMSASDIAAMGEAKEAKTAVANWFENELNHTLLAGVNVLKSAGKLLQGEFKAAGEQFMSGPGTSWQKATPDPTDLNKMLPGESWSGWVKRIRDHDKKLEQEKIAPYLAERAKAKGEAVKDIDKIDKALTKQIATFGMSSEAAAVWEAKTAAAAAGVGHKADEVDRKFKLWQSTQQAISEALEFPTKSLTIMDEYTQRLDRLSKLAPTNFQAWQTGVEKLNETLDKTIASKAGELFTSTRTPLERFNAEVKDIGFLAQLPGEKGISGQVADRAIASRIRDLEKMLPDWTQLAPSLARGSTEEYRFRAQAEARAEMGGIDPQERIKQALERLEALEKQRAAKDKEIVEAYRQAVSTPPANF